MIRKGCPLSMSFANHIQVMYLKIVAETSLGVLLNIITRHRAALWSARVSITKSVATSSLKNYFFLFT